VDKKIGRLVHFPNAQQNSPLCGKVSSLALSFEGTLGIQEITCIDCACILLRVQSAANDALAVRICELLEERNRRPGLDELLKGG
jgi:hypothetical protein